MAENHPSSQTEQYTFEQFADIRLYQRTLSFSPDGASIAYVDNTSGQFNLWRRPVTGGKPTQLTFYSDHAVREIAWSPDGSQILYTGDHQGDEFHQLYVIPAAGGEPTQLTDAPQVQHYLAAAPWSPDGSAIAYAGNDRAPTDQDVMIREMASGDVRRIVTAGGTYFPIAWAPDGQSITVLELVSNTDQNVWLAPTAGGEATLLTPHEGEIQFNPSGWVPDGSGFYLGSDEGREFAGLAFQNIKTGERHWVETPEWDIEHIELSANGRVLAWVVNEDGYSRLFARDLTTGQLLDLPTLPRGEITVMTMSRDGGKLAILLAQAHHPTELFIVDLTGHRVHQLSDGFLGGIDENRLIEPELIHYPTFDGRLIPAYLYKPRGDGPFPVVLSIHGGPEAQERPDYSYSGLYQYLVHRGIGVLAPNVRGSTGYGKSYQRLIHRDWGGGELRDFDAAVRYLQSLPWVDDAKIAVFGGSFGGFATLSCISRLPEHWAAAVDIVGPANLVTFAKAVPPTWRKMMAQWVGDPETEVDFLMERSPISYVDQICTPLFIIQGANDPRVVKSESDQMVEQLRARGLPVRYDVYDDEGHGFTKRANAVKAIGDAARFLEEHLLA